jgi:hypothetical protein
MALSPYAIEGEHGSNTRLPAELTDAVHRVITDQSRITQAYISQNSAEGFSEEKYVELVGIAVIARSRQAPEPGS